MTMKLGILTLQGIIYRKQLLVLQNINHFAEVSTFTHDDAGMENRKKEACTISSGKLLK